MSWVSRVGTVIGASPLPILLRAIRPGLRIVLYHHVGDENDLTRHLGCTTSSEMFESHVSSFARNYDVVSLADVVSGDPLPRRPLLITFDDAYRSVLEAAGPVLRSHSLPSVLFLVTDPVFRGKIILDNLLSFACCRFENEVRELAEPGAVDPVRDILFRVIPEGGLSERARIRKSLQAICGTEADHFAEKVGLYLQEKDLPDLERDRISLARHSASHVNMRLIDDPRAELEDDWIACGLDPEQRAFSFPFGGFVDAEPSIRSLVKARLGPLFLVEGCSNAIGQEVYYRTSPRTRCVADVNADLEVLGPMRRFRKRTRIEALEKLTCR